jgi:cytochrome b6-f complex iron-sulfur subunit
MAETAQIVTKTPEAKPAGATPGAYPTREQILAKYKERVNVLPSAEGGVSRRSFMVAVAAGWSLFALAMTGGALALFRAMVPNVDFTKILKVKIGPPDRFAPNSVDETFKDKKIWVVRDTEKIVAIRTVCTHLGCTPNWSENENKFKCPCHGSGFRGPKGFLNAGVNFEGPAPRPLERFAIKLGDDGQLVVDESKTFAWEKGEWTNPESFYPV